VKASLLKKSRTPWDSVVSVLQCMVLVADLRHTWRTVCMQLDLPCAPCAERYHVFALVLRTDNELHERQPKPVAVLDLLRPCAPMAEDKETSQRLPVVAQPGRTSRPHFKTRIS
jgi:hypothetical protein